MGLLSDPEYGSVKWVRVLKRIHGPLCFLCYLGALVWFVMLGNVDFNNETYFSENALLPGLVTNEFNGEHSANQYYRDFLQELEDKYEDTAEMPVPWLVAKLSQLHLEVYTHNFTLDYPLGQGQTFKGTNVYAILRAPRTSSLEAIVVSAPYRALGSYQKGTAAGIALMLAFAQFAAPQKYWAKDLIFLITEHEQLGMQAWLEAYHGLQSEAETFHMSLGSFWKPSNSKLDFSQYLSGLNFFNGHQKCLKPGKLKGRSGSIQAAINLEFDTPKIKYVEVKIEGLNGQLPNLDLVNLVHKLCSKSGIHHSHRNSYSWMQTKNKMDVWTNGFWTMFNMVVAQIDGVPDGNHGLFHRFGVEAVTLEGRGAGDLAGTAPNVHSLHSTSFYRLGITLESILRSLNNLLERFHQSYFFYLLAGTNRFISIGQYMISLCLLCSAILIRALSLWVSIQQDEEEDDNKKEKTEKDKDSDSEVLGDEETPEGGERDPEVLGEKKPEDTLVVNRKRGKKEPIVPGDKKVQGGKTEVNKEQSSMNIVNIGTNYLLVHLVGYAVMNSPILFSKIGAKYGYPSEVCVYYGLCATCLCLALVPWGGAGRGRREAGARLLAALVQQSAACLCAAMHNVALAALLAAAYTPLALLCGHTPRGRSTSSSVCLQLKRALCVAVHPLVLVTLSMAAYSRAQFGDEPLVDSIVRGRDAAMQAVMFSVADSMIYGNWLFNLTAVVILPMWMLYWQILWTEVDPNTK